MSDEAPGPDTSPDAGAADDGAAAPEVCASVEADGSPGAPVLAQRRLLARLKYVEPSQLVAAMAVIVILAAAAVALSILGWPFGDDPFADLPDDPSVRVGLAGYFPADDEDPLIEPTGIAIDGSRVYITEAGAGRVAIFSVKGERAGEVELEVADGQSRAVPTAITEVGSRRFAVVDARGNRVYVYRVSGGSAELLYRLGEDDPDIAPARPTAVTYHGRELYVADSTAGDIKVYDRDGGLVRSLSGDAATSLGHVGGMAVAGRQLVVSQSGANRVLALDLKTGSVIATFEDAYALPRGVAAVRDGVAVAEVLGAAVRVCDADGEQTHSIDAKTVPGGPPAAPECAAWHDRTGRLYVTEPDLGRVTVYGVRR